MLAPIYPLSSLSPPPRASKPEKNRLTVRLLVPGAGTWTTKLLGLAPPVVGNEQCAVVLDEGLLELVLGMLVDVLLVVGDDGFGNGLADGVDLRGVTTTRDADANVDIGKLVNTEDQDGLVDLESQNLGLNEGKRLSVNLDETLSGLAVGDSSRSLLLAEALHTLGGHVGRLWDVRAVSIGWASSVLQIGRAHV